MCELLRKLRSLLDFAINSAIAESQNPGGIGRGFVWCFREGRGDLSSVLSQPLLFSPLFSGAALMLRNRLPDGRS